MRRNTLSTVAIAGLFAISVVGVFAQDAFTPPATPEAAIAAREALMKQNGATLRGAAGLTGADAVTAMTTLRDNFSHIPALFPVGSEGGDALPAIWDNFDAFTALAAAGQKAAEDGIAAAQAGDAQAYEVAFKAIGATCGQCHQQFRKD